MSKINFIHLKNRSDYSIVDGLSKIENIVKKASALNMPAIALTDFTNLCGMLKFYKHSHAAGIKPIIGADFYIESQLLKNKLSAFTVLALNTIGYNNLRELISLAHQISNTQNIQFIKRSWLSQLNEGILIISGASKGDIGKCLTEGNRALARKYLAFYNKYFPDRYYLELTRTNRQDEKDYLSIILDFSNKENLPVVATNDVRFLNKEDFQAHEVRVSIQKGLLLEKFRTKNIYSKEQYLKSSAQMCQLFKDIPESLNNSVEIAKRCNVIIEAEKKYFLPVLNQQGTESKKIIADSSILGLEKRLELIFPDDKERKKNHSKYIKRLNSELKIINKMGYADYFLIIMEFIKWAKKNSIPVGPGRGSGAGSLVAYALSITDVNPIKFNLLFERFLNPERISLPDFDIDFCMEKRDLVIEHIEELYGKNSVSQIVTFNKMAARAAIRDVGRTLGYPYSFVTQIAKLIPAEVGITLKKSMQSGSLFSKSYHEDDEVKRLVDVAKKLEGTIKNIGTHAGGVVISPTKMTDFTPLYYEETGKHSITQFDKDDIEDIGLVKFDLLGLRTLTIIQQTLEKIKCGRKKIIDIHSISLNDEKVFKLLQTAETTGIFQLESYGIKNLIKRLQPDCFEDIIALVALFRPGPLQSGMVRNFINRKKKLEKISYPHSTWQHKSLKPILESTYGIVLYQEQVMQIAQVLAGYSLGKADILRRAMGKKNKDDMAQQREYFEAGAKKNGIDTNLAMKIFDIVEKFAGYGFNKSHSTAYALISYQTLWLKTHYPSQFIAAVMSYDMDNTEKLSALVKECKRMKISILPPDVNVSNYHFHTNKHDEIVYGMGAIKGIGKTLVEYIVQERVIRGSFSDILDFCNRLTAIKINKRTLEIMILSGMLDSIGPHRASMISSLEDILKFSTQTEKTKISGQKDFFGTLKKEYSYTDCTPWSDIVVQSKEYEVLGLYLTKHPINQYIKKIRQHTERRNLSDISLNDIGKCITSLGVIVNYKKRSTKKNSNIGIYTFDDDSACIDVIAFEDQIKKYEHLLQRNRVLLFRGTVFSDKISGKFIIKASNFCDINQVKEKNISKLSIFLKETQINNDFLNLFYQCIKKYSPGKTPIDLYYQKGDLETCLRFSNKWNVHINDCFLNELNFLIGKQNIKTECD